MMRLVWLAYWRFCRWLDTVMLRDIGHDTDTPASGRECGADQIAAADAVEECAEPLLGPPWTKPAEPVDELEAWIRDLGRELSPYYDGGTR